MLILDLTLQSLVDICFYLAKFSVVSVHLYQSEKTLCCASVKGLCISCDLSLIYSISVKS